MMQTATHGSVATNPTAADVQTKLTAVIASQGNQSLLKTAFDTEQEDVAELREEADAQAFETVFLRLIGEEDQ